MIVSLIFISFNILKIHVHILMCIYIYIIAKLYNNWLIDCSYFDWFGIFGYSYFGIMDCINSFRMNHNLFGYN